MYTLLYMYVCVYVAWLFGYDYQTERENLMRML